VCSVSPLRRILLFEVVIFPKDWPRGTLVASSEKQLSFEGIMTTHVAHGYESGGMDELGLDRLPGMPLLGFFVGTVFSLAIWGTFLLIAYGVTN
jgi:hypothetical protein